MSSMITPIEKNSLILHFGPILKRISDEEFFQLCELNKDWRIERTKEGDLIIMPPTGGKTGNLNFILTARFGRWVEKDKRGVGFDSSTGFTLPNGAKRSPDLSWVELSRWNALTEKEKEEFPPLCPDFVLELRSRTDSIEALQAKMVEYIDNGARLGWLIDPIEKRVYIYRSQKEMEVIDDPKMIDGEDILPGFVINLSEIWD
jgi:Uma2 family endonuclease